MPEHEPIEANTKRLSPALSVATRSAVFFDHAERGSGPVRVVQYNRQWIVLDSMGDAVAECGFDENAADLIAALLNREREHLPNNGHVPTSASAGTTLPNEK